jgi:hypothetical protein
MPEFVTSARKSLCRSLDDPLLLYLALIGQWRFSLLTDSLTATMQIAERVYSLAQEQNGPGFMMGACNALAAGGTGGGKLRRIPLPKRRALTELPNALNSSPHWPDFSTAKATSRRNLCRRSPAGKSLVGIAGTDVQKRVAGFAREHDGPQTQEANTHFVKFLDSVLACSSPHQSC